MTVPLVAGNWKMNGSQADCVELARQIVRGLSKNSAEAEVALAPPFTALSAVRKAIRTSKIKMAAQNCHWQESGAFTGEVSPSMLEEIGCDFVILGHSERRHIFHESDDMVARKLIPVIRRGMRPILCIGETAQERHSDQTAVVIARQLDSALKGFNEGDIDKIEIAYEPVWAIGTGDNATAEQISEAHAQIRNFIRVHFGETNAGKTRILYGGSVKPDNAAMLAKVEEVNGLLVGGASLAAETFLPIVRAFSES